MDEDENDRRCFMTTHARELLSRAYGAVEAAFYREAFTPGLWLSTLN